MTATATGVTVYVVFALHVIDKQNINICLDIWEHGRCVMHL